MVFKLHVSVFFLPVHELHVIEDLVFHIERDLEIVHVQLHNKDFTAPEVSVGSGPENDLNNLIDNVSKNHKGNTHDGKHVNNLNGITTINVAV